MALNPSKCNHLTPLRFKGLMLVGFNAQCTFYVSANGECICVIVLSVRLWRNFKEICHQYSACEWKELERFHRLQVVGQGRWDPLIWEVCGCNMSLVIAGILTKHSKIIHHASGKNWKGFQGQKWKFKVVERYRRDMHLDGVALSLTCFICLWFVEVVFY